MCACVCVVSAGLILQSSASLRTNRPYRFTLKQSHNLRFNNIINSNNTSKFNIINNENNKIFVRLKL